MDRIKDRSTVEELRWWADEMAARPRPTPWQQGMIRLMRQAADKIAALAAAPDQLADISGALMDAGTVRVTNNDYAAAIRELTAQRDAALAAVPPPAHEPDASFDAGYAKGFADGLDESAGDPRVDRIEAGFKAIHSATNGEYSREDMIVMDALQSGRDFAVRLARREQHIQQLIRERAAAPPPAQDKEPRCVVCHTVYSDKGQQTGPVWGIWGPGIRICKWCVQAGRDRARAERHSAESVHP